MTNEQSVMIKGMDTCTEPPEFNSSSINSLAV